MKDTEEEEVVRRIALCYAVVVKSEHVERYNTVSIYIQRAKYQNCNIKLDSRWHKHQPSKFDDNGQVTSIWDIPTEEAKDNFQGTIIKDSGENTCLMIDITVASDQNDITREVEIMSRSNTLKSKYSTYEA